MCAPRQDEIVNDRFSRRYLALPEAVRAELKSYVRVPLPSFLPPPFATLTL